jgi:hypothetical protein
MRGPALEGAVASAEATFWDLEEPLSSPVVAVAAGPDAAFDEEDAPGVAAEVDAAGCEVAMAKSCAATAMRRSASRP